MLCWVCALEGGVGVEVKVKAMHVESWQAVSPDVLPDAMRVP